MLPHPGLDFSTSRFHHVASSPPVVALRRRTIRELRSFHLPPRGGGGDGGFDADPPTGTGETPRAGSLESVDTHFDHAGPDVFRAEERVHQKRERRSIGFSSSESSRYGDRAPSRYRVSRHREIILASIRSATAFFCRDRAEEAPCGEQQQHTKTPRSTSFPATHRQAIDAFPPPPPHPPPSYSLRTLPSPLASTTVRNGLEPVSCPAKVTRPNERELGCVRPSPPRPAPPRLAYG